MKIEQTNSKINRNSKKSIKYEGKIPKMFDQSTQNQMSEEFVQNNREMIFSSIRTSKSISANFMQEERTYSNDSIDATSIKYSEYEENVGEMVIQKSEASNDQPIQIQNENANRDESMLNHEIDQSKNEVEYKNKLCLKYLKLNKKIFETHEEWIKQIKDENAKLKIMIEELNIKIAERDTIIINQGKHMAKQEELIIKLESDIAEGLQSKSRLNKALKEIVQICEHYESNK